MTMEEIFAKIELVNPHWYSQNVAGNQNPSILDKVEEMLNVSLPIEYRNFLLKHGCIVDYISGVCDDPLSKSRGSVVADTQYARRTFRDFPERGLVICDNEESNFVAVLDNSLVDVYYPHRTNGLLGHSRELFESFSNYLESVLSDVLDIQKEMYQ